MSVNAEQTLDALLEYSDIALYGAKIRGAEPYQARRPTKPEDGMSNVFRVA